MKISNSSQLIALYGSLMSPFFTLEQLGLKSRLELLGPCTLQGRLYDLGDYPGLLMPTGAGDIVEAELYRFSDSGVLRVLDEFEDYDPGNESASLYLRKKFLLESPRQEAWVYLYNQSVIESDYIAGGNWQQYVAGKAGGRRILQE